ncbi:MAG: CPBP family intramembrane glutamic endopeptidase [Aggregatilineales bacterium]
MTARRSIVGRLFDPSNPQTSPSSPLPTLRSALRLYLLVLLATAGIIIGLVINIDITFLLFVSAIFVFNGFTFGALLLTRKRPTVLAGQPPSNLALGVGLLAGVTLWVVCSWLLFVFRQSLDLVFGKLPSLAFTGVSSGVTLLGQAIIFGVIIPLSEGWLFFGFILSAARGIGNWRGVWLTALLFGLFGMFTVQWGISAIPSYFLLGLVGGTLVMWSGSMWPGILLLSAFELAEPLGLGRLLTSFLKNQYQDVFSFSWLTAVAVFAFLTFALTRIVRAFRARQTAVLPPPPGGGWWLPLLVVVVLVILIGRAEIQTRILNPVQIAPVQSTPGAQTAPPIAPLVTPTVTIPPGFFASPAP